MLRFAFLVVLWFASVQSAVYLHNPRGSSNRLNTADREIQTPNRLFNTKGNIRGGYNVGENSMKYVQGSILPIEWTMENSCNSSTTRCEVVLQYMCGAAVRDGSEEGRLGDNCSSVATCAAQTNYGMHEDFPYYDRCLARQRNKGLFTANQVLGDSATSTRQNPGGDEYGFECPEEKEYYPYWQPTPWKDIAVFTDDVSRCDYYRRESENVKGRSWCDLCHTGSDDLAPISQSDCESLGGTWRQGSSQGLAAPDCNQTLFSKNNYLGNGLSRTALVYNWTVPNIVQSNCVFRVRYNVTPSEIRFDDDFHSNGRLNPIDRFGLASQSEATNRGYIIKDKPEVDLFGGGLFSLALDIEEASFGSTDEDRSHVFSIVARSTGIAQSANIYNLNVRGKRGNIVQVFPSVEYDFVPNTLELLAGDYIHFQWTGSDHNPDDNAGQGTAGTDRSNVILLAEPVYPKGEFDQLSSLHRYGHWPRCYPASLMRGSPFLGMTAADRIYLATSGNSTDNLLNDASAYFDLGPRRITSPGIYYYMGTRNNRFSNRDQKGRIIVRNSTIPIRAIASPGSSYQLAKTTSIN